MEALKFGPLVVEETDSGVRFQLQNGSPTDLSANEVPLLMDFLKKHLEVSANRRSSWRLPLHSLGGTEADKLAVRILRGDHLVETRVRDISLTGIFVETQEPVGERGDSVDVEVQFDSESVTLRGLIVRQDATMQRIALHFPSCVDAAGSLCPPKKYQKIFHRLEKIWIDKKLGLVWS